MKNRLLRSALASIALLAAASSHAAPSAPSAPAVARPGVVLPGGGAVKALLQTKLAITGNVAGQVGETRPVQAKLTGKDNTPLAKRRVTFTIGPKNGSKVPGGSMNVGNAMTDADGVAKIDLAVPELAQGNYEITAKYAGGDGDTSSTDDANLLVVKAIMKFEMSSLTWGTYKNEPGAPYGSIMISLRRTSDDRAVERAVKIKVKPNGKPAKEWTLPASTNHSIALTDGASGWLVEVQWDGDDSYQSTTASKQYVKPG